MKQQRGPEFIRFFRPILEVLVESGGSGTASEIVDRSLELTKVSESEQEALNKNGQSRVKNQVHWARQYLVWHGYLDSSKRGVWSLTDKGKLVNLKTLNALEVFKSVQRGFAKAKKAGGPEIQPLNESIELVPRDTEIQDHRTALLNLIKSLFSNLAVSSSRDRTSTCSRSAASMRRSGPTSRAGSCRPQTSRASRCSENS
jgi:restriction system protein